MAKILIVYGTKEGQTMKIAQRIGDVVRQYGYQVDLNNAEEIREDSSLQNYSGILVGCSMHLQQYSPAVTNFIRQYKPHLERLPSAFFSVSMIDATSSWGAQLEKPLNSFYNKTGWHPKTVGRFGGALTYTKYGFFTKHMMKWMAQKGGFSTDTSCDHDYTDWDQVAKFAKDYITDMQERIGGK